MKKCFLLAVLALSSFVSIAQEERAINFFTGEDGVVYTDNSRGAWFSLELPGDSIKDAGMPNAFLVGDNIFQIIKKPYSPEEYGNKDSTDKEIALLKGYMKWESDYVQDMLKQELELSDEVFVNKQGKRFLLWYYAMGNVEKSDSVQVDNQATHHLSLNWVSNQNIVGLNLPVFENEDKEKQLAVMKSIAETVQVFGGEMDLEALYYRLQAARMGTGFEYNNPDRYFSFDIPDWLNVLKSPMTDFWVGTMPDLDNIKNAVSVKWYPKDVYDSFDDFNEDLILSKSLGQKDDGGSTWMGKNEVKVPKNCNGIGYRVFRLDGSVMYHCQYVTFETKTNYLLVMFIATPETYDRNLGKFEEFLTGIRVKTE